MRKIVIAGICLSVATISQLRAKGILVATDVEQIFDGALARVVTLEPILVPNDPTAAKEIHDFISHLKTMP